MDSGWTDRSEMCSSPLRTGKLAEAKYSDLVVHPAGQGDGGVGLDGSVFLLGLKIPLKMC